MVKYYRGISDMPIYNFYKFLETQNYHYLVDGWDERKELEINEKTCTDLWNEVYEQYCLLTNDNESLLYFDKASELIYLKTRYYFVDQVLLQLEIDLKPLDIQKEYLDSLAKWEYYGRKNEKIEDTIKRLRKQWKGSINKIQLIENFINDAKPDEDNKVTFIKQVVKMEQALNRNEIDVRRVSVEKWCAMLEEIREKSNALMKQRNGRQ